MRLLPRQMQTKPLLFLARLLRCCRKLVLGMVLMTCRPCELHRRLFVLLLLLLLLLKVLRRVLKCCRRLVLRQLVMTTRPCDLERRMLVLLLLLLTCQCKCVLLWLLKVLRRLLQCCRMLAFRQLLMTCRPWE